jgi:hypothetical protein
MMAPAIYLPKKGSPDRDIVALAALSILFFTDPANQME